MNSKLFQMLQNSTKDIACVASFLLVGVVFSRFGYFDYGDIGLAFLQNDMLLLLAQETGSSFVDLIKVIEPSYYFPSLYQHTFNYYEPDRDPTATRLRPDRYPAGSNYKSISEWFPAKKSGFYLRKVQKMNE